MPRRFRKPRPGWILRREKPALRSAVARRIGGGRRPWSDLRFYLTRVRKAEWYLDVGSSSPILDQYSEMPVSQYRRIRVRIRYGRVQGSVRPQRPVLYQTLRVWKHAHACRRRPSPPGRPLTACFISQELTHILTSFLGNGSSSTSSSAAQLVAHRGNGRSKCARYLTCSRDCQISRLNVWRMPGGPARCGLWERARRFKVRGSRCDYR